MSDVQDVRDIHISYYFSLEYTDNITLRILGFIPVPFMEARPVNLTARNSICDTVHQKASTNLESQSGTTANKKGKGNVGMCVWFTCAYMCV